MGGRKVKRRPVPAGVFSADIDSLARDGRGVAHIDSKAVFIAGALPGEQVWFRYTVSRGQYGEGVTTEIVQPSADRVTPKCAHFGICGGCVLQHLDPTRQIHYKQDWLLDNLQRIGKVIPDKVLPPLTGPHWGYRYKARLGVKYVFKKERVLVGFRERDSNFLADLQRCEVLHPKVGKLLPELAELISTLTIYNRIPQVELAAGENQVALNLRVLDPPSTADLEQLKTFAQQHDILFFLQSKGPTTTRPLNDEQPVELNYRLPEYDLQLDFLPNHFTQVNPGLNRQMVSRVLKLLAVQATDNVLDLFCGLGNFTLALARYAAYVTGVEGEPDLVAWAQRNAQRNSIVNARFLAANLAASEQIPLWQGQYQKILLDPPRSGAIAILPALAACQPERIVYVSCHPATLARDAGILVHEHGFRLRQAGVMDMFPHTAHVESIAVFERG